MTWRGMVTMELMSDEDYMWRVSEACADVLARLQQAEATQRNIQRLEIALEVLRCIAGEG